MRREAALGLVGVVFAAGLAAGLLGARLIPRAPSDPRPGRLGPPPFERYFTRGDLDLSADQQRQIKEIFRRQREKFETLHRDLRPEVESLMDQTQDEIEALLTPEQLERYRSRRDRWRGRRERLGPRPFRRQRRQAPPPERTPDPPAELPVESPESPPKDGPAGD